MPGSLVGDGFGDPKGTGMHTSTVKVLRGPITLRGSKPRLQSAGSLLSADRLPAGETTNRLITERLTRHKVRIFGV
ncbi:hypothetical protein ACQPXM_24755 [Kribbella sp. CA-253562]|uniref:hypothetical protein n=1 Tax=Kribbella sp. CA-253562 TaxID=3239942 RepID=UPI003D917034